MPTALNNKTIIKMAGHIIVIFSLFSLLLYLYQTDMLSFSVERIKINCLLISFIPLLMGFIVAVLSWQYLLSVNGYRLTFRQSLQTVGLSVFAKYIPGKIWATMGRVSLTAAFGVPLHNALIISLHLQVLFLSSGMMLGLLGLTFSGKLGSANFAIYTGIIVLAIFILLPGSMKALRKFKFKTTLQPCESDYSAHILLKAVALFILQWGCWSTGFYFLLNAVFQGRVLSISIAFAFPLSVCIGIFSIISPGGLGVREGVLAGALLFMGISLSDATTISIFARLWFLCGELSIFLYAIVIRKKLENKSRQVV